MKNGIKTILFSLIVSLFLTFPETVSAQTELLAELRAELISPWLVTVGGEDRTRTLRITDAAQKTDGTILLEAIYGWSDGRQSPIKAVISQTAQERKLTITTQAGSRIIAIEKASGVFTGVFTLKSGEEKNVTITKFSEKPSATINVPPSCEALDTAFRGVWVGTWRQGNIPQQWLRISEVDANCKAKFSYSSNPNSFGTETAEIKKGVLSFLCNSSTNGTCSFTRVGAKLSASYSNPSGGRNTATFEKSQ